MVVMFSTFAALSVLIRLVLAQFPTPPPVPPQAQLVLLNLDLSCCARFGSRSHDFIIKSTVSGTIPEVYGAGQQIYYSDVAGNITIPASVFAWASRFHAASASASVEVDLSLTNASPFNLIAYKDKVQIPIPKTPADVTVRFPSGNGTLEPIGPATLGVANQPHRVFLGEVKATVSVKDKRGHKYSVQVGCDDHGEDIVLASINVDDSVGPAFAPSVGYVPQFDPTPDKHRSNAWRFPIQCRDDYHEQRAPSLNYTLELIVKGTTPTCLTAGEAFNITQFNAFFNFPSDTFALFVQAFNITATHGYFLSALFSDFDLLWTNVQPAVFNVNSEVEVRFLAAADDPVPLFGIPLLLLNPSSGVIYENFTIGQFTADQAGSFAALNVGQLKGSLNIAEINGPGFTQFSGSCNVHSPIELIAAPISD